MSNDMSNVGPRLELEAFQTVVPTNVTNPRQTRCVSVTGAVGPGIFQGCLNVVLYYNKATSEDSGWVVAGWFKESLTRSLAEQPLLSGRLRRGEDGKGQPEIVSNDCGIRLVEAKIPMTLREFLDEKGKEKLEAELVFWKEVDGQDPQFCPLLYVQVTNFKCGGYSVGISCSLLLADILVMDNFISRWANLHKDILSKNKVLKLPLFYVPNLKPPTFSLAGTFSPAPSKNCGQTMTFKVANEGMDLKNDLGKTIAGPFIEEVESKLDTNMPSEFYLLVKESSMVIKVHECKKQEHANFHLNLKNKVTSSSWADLGINDIAFNEGHKPAHVSLWVGSIDDGLIMAIPNSVTSEMNIIVSVPN